MPTKEQRHIGRAIRKQRRLLRKIVAAYEEGAAKVATSMARVTKAAQSAAEVLNDLSNVITDIRRKEVE